MSTPEQDEDLAFEEAFNAATAELTEQQAQKTPEVEAAPAPPAAAAPATAAPAAVATPDENAEPVVDPFASLPPQVRELLAAIPSIRSELETVRRVANMVPALQSRLDKLNQPAAAATEQVPGAKSRYAKVEALRRELPEIAEALDEIANDRHGAPEPQGQPAPSPTPPAQQAESPHEKALTAVRPTWANDLMSSDFHLWLAQQPRQYQALVTGTDDAGDILHALGQFDQYRARTTAQTTTREHLNQARSTRMAAAVTPQGDGRRQRPQASAVDEEDAAFAAAFNKARGR